MKRFGLIMAMAGLVISACSTQGMMGYPPANGARGSGMMGGYGGGMMGGYGGMMGSGMMGSLDYIPTGNATPLTIDQAAEQARKYVAAWGYDSLSISEIMEFSNHFYIEVGEKAGQYKAFELLMNKYTGAVSPEPGPDMMWNVKYGMMGSGMMGGYSPSAQAFTPMTITDVKARELAQVYLDSQASGLTVETGADMFYGYYTIHVLKDGKVVGMLGVSGYTGQIWYHSWHATFIGIKEY